MGWWWNSSSQKDDSASSAPQKQTRSQYVPQRSPTRDEQAAEAEFKQLLAAFDSNNDTKQTSKSIDTSSPNAGDFTTPAKPTTSSIAPESLYPDTMSCRSAFDYAFFCQSFGGQFVNVYRYGELRSCSDHWDNFWLCMRTRSFPEAERKRVIRDHNRKKEIKYKTGPSSEDVWDMRTEPVRDAFQGDFVALEREMKAEEEAGRQSAI